MTNTRTLEMGHDDLGDRFHGRIVDRWHFLAERGTAGRTLQAQRSELTAAQRRNKAWAPGRLSGNSSARVAICQRATQIMSATPALRSQTVAEVSISSQGDRPWP